MKNLKNKTDKNPLNTILFVYFLQARLFTEKFSRTTIFSQLSIRVFSSEGHCGLVEIEGYRMVFASICEHASSAFIFASTSSDQFCHASSEHFKVSTLFCAK